MEEKKLEIKGTLYRFMPLCTCGAEMTPFYNDKSEKMALGGFCVECKKYEDFPPNTKPYPRYEFGGASEKFVSAFIDPARKEKAVEIKLRTYCVVPVCSECGSEMMNYNKYSNQETTRGVFCLKCQKAETLSWDAPHYPRYETEEVL